MKKDNISEELTYNCFEELLCKASPEISDIINSYFSDEFFASINKLKAIVCKNAKVYNYIKNAKPRFYKDIQKIFYVISNLYERDSFTNCLEYEYYNVMKSFTDYLNTNQSISLFVDADDNQTSYSSSNPELPYIQEVLIRCVNDNPNTNASNEAEDIKYINVISTYSPAYAYFIIKNINNITTTKTTFRTHNTCADCANEVYNLINSSSMSSEHKIRHEILFFYLCERVTNMKYKFFSYQYASTFINELENSKIHKAVIKQHSEEYIFYFKMFRDVCLFADKEFFKELHIIISQLINARIMLAKNVAKYPENIVYEIQNQLYIELPNEILNILSDCQDDAISSDATFDISELSEFINKPIDILFPEQDDRTKSHINLWNTVQDELNNHINMKYGYNSMDMSPRNTADIYKNIVENPFFRLHMLHNGTYIGYKRNHPTQL